MTDLQFKHCLSEVPNYAEKDGFVSDLYLSDIWKNTDPDIDPETGLEICDLDLISQLRSIWDAYHRTVPQIAADAGMSCRKLAERFCIPYRTVENWSAGTREAPAYVRLMMQECLGLIKR